MFLFLVASHDFLNSVKERARQAGMALSVHGLSEYTLKGELIPKKIKCAKDIFDAIDMEYKPIEEWE